MPVHNEEKLLPYCLASLKDAPLSELVVLLDRCTDNSEALIRAFKPKYPVKVFFAREHTWRNRVAEVVNECFGLCSGDVVYDLFADVVYDVAIFDASFFECCDMVSFRCLPWDVGVPAWRVWYENFLRKAFEKVDFGESVWRGMVFGTKRKVWQQLGFRDVPSQFGEHLQFRDYRDRLVQSGYNYCFVGDTKNFDLRDPTLSQGRQVLDGRRRAYERCSALRVLLHSVVHVKPHVLASYLNAKNEA